MASPQVEDEQRRRQEQAPLGADQAAVGTPVVPQRGLVQRLGVGAEVSSIGPAGARVVGGAADVEQLIPVVTRPAMLVRRHGGERRRGAGREPFAVVHRCTTPGCTLYVRHPSRVQRSVVASYNVVALSR